MGYYLGIDVGKSGGFAFFKENGELVSLSVTPVIGSEYDLGAIRSLLDKDIKHIVIEDVHAIHGMSAGSQFSFGYGKGVLVALAAALQIPYTLVTPKNWQKEMWDSSAIITVATKKKKKDGTYARKTDTKKTSLVAAKRLFPKESFLASSRCSVPHDGLVDAALMGEYCRRKFK